MNLELQRGLRRIAGALIALTALAAMAAGVLLTPALRRDVWVGLVVVLAAMLIGFVPLRIFLRHGPEHIVAAWVAAMILRMIACLIGLAIVLTRYDVDRGVGVLTVCGGYFALLMVETFGMIRLIRGAFEMRTESQEAR